MGLIEKKPEIADMPLAKQVEILVDALQTAVPPQYWVYDISHQALWVTMQTLLGPRDAALIVSRCQVDKS